MPTEETPAAPPTQPAASPAPGDFYMDQEVGAVVYTDEKGRPRVPLQRVQELTRELRALKEAAAKPADLEPIRAKVRQEVEAEYTPRLLQTQTEAAILRLGLMDDPEVAEEVIDQYRRKAKPGEDGKVPTVSAWLKAQKEAHEGKGAVWLRSYLQTPADPAPPAKPAAPAKPPSNPNAGASKATAPAQTGLSDEEIDRLSPAELIRRFDEIKAFKGIGKK